MVMPKKFKEVGGIIPTIVHGRKILKGYKDCLKYIDKNFG